MIDKIYFIKFKLPEVLDPCYIIKEYKVSKITNSRIYYYNILDEDTDESDIKFTSNNINICNIEHVGTGTMEISMWCEKEYLEVAKQKLKKNLELYLEKRTRKIYADTKEVFRSTIKI